MLEGGPIDVLTGDYLAELTMLILWKARQKDPDAGYAPTFLTPDDHVLGDCLDRGIRVVTNAGGLNPAGWPRGCEELAGRLGLAPQGRLVEGDDLSGRLDEPAGAGHELATPRHRPAARRRRGRAACTANAYLGGLGIAAALDAGADIVVARRVTDASLVVGPAAWWHGWARDDLDALAGAVVAGHVIECGPQATGGNYSFLDEIAAGATRASRSPRSPRTASRVITKHPGTGGAVSVGHGHRAAAVRDRRAGLRQPGRRSRASTRSQLDAGGPDRVADHRHPGQPPPPR